MEDPDNERRVNVPYKRGTKPEQKVQCDYVSDGKMIKGRGENRNTLELRRGGTTKGQTERKAV